MHNRICLITKNRPSGPPARLKDNIEMDRIATKIKWKYMSLLHCILMIKICMISHQIFYFLLFILISFYISRYHFSQIFKTSFNIWQKNFCHKFYFFNGFTQTPTPAPPSIPPLFCKGVPAPYPLFKVPSSLWPILPSFSKSLFPLPTFLLHPLLS